MKRFRHEHKFILNAIDAELLRDSIASICELDSNVAETGYYNVRSLYFDTIDDQYLEENLAGVNIRHKYRIRIYNCDDSHIVLERKETEMGLKHKTSCIISKAQSRELATGNMFVGLGKNQVVLEEMCMEHMMKFLQPKVIVDYERIPFVYPSGNVRITFDYNVSSSTRVEDFWDKNAMINPVLNDNSVVFEVKYDDLLPFAIRRIINRYMQAEQSAFSKYVYARSNANNG